MVGNSFYSQIKKGVSQRLYKPQAPNNNAVKFKITPALCELE